VSKVFIEASQLEEKTERYANANFAEYLVATNAGVPLIDVHFIDKPDTIYNPLGVRGIGEIGITGIAAAIANAVYNARGNGYGIYRSLRKNCYYWKATNNRNLALLAYKLLSTIDRARGFHHFVFPAFPAALDAKDQRRI
jgi:hypothetical protein